MARLSLRDRFFTPQVARALTSPSGILSLGAGAAVGIVATAPVSVPLAVVGAVVGGAVGLGARVALALPRNRSAPRIDPFAVNVPWRDAVIDALKARTRFTQAVKTFRDGPLREAMAEVADRIDAAIEECWRVAQQGQVVADARQAINDREIRWELQQSQQAIGTAGPNPAQAGTLRSLDAQLATAARLDALIASTRDQLNLLNARLDESVTRAIELSVTNQTSGVGALGDDVGAIVDDLETLRRAIEDVDGETPTSPSTEGTAPAPGGQAQASPGT